MKVWLKQLIHHDLNSPFIFANDEDDSTHYIECTAEERTILDRAESLFFNLQSGFIQDRLRVNHE